MIEEGNYSIPQAMGPSVGKYRVEIYSYGSASGAAEKQGLDSENQAGAASAQQWIPEVYNKKSTLEVEIVAGNNRHDFSLVADAAVESPPVANETPEEHPEETVPQPAPAGSAAPANNTLAEEAPAQPAASEPAGRPAYVYTPRSAPRRSRGTWYTATISIWLVVLVACFGWWQYNVRQYNARQFQKRG